MWRTSTRPAAHSSSGQGDVTDTRTPAIDCRKPPEIATFTASAKSSRHRTSTTRAQRGTTGDLEMSRSSTVRDYIDGDNSRMRRMDDTVEVVAARPSHYLECSSRTS